MTHETIQEHLYMNKTNLKSQRVTKMTVIMVLAAWLSGA